MAHTTASPQTHSSDAHQAQNWIKGDDGLDHVQALARQLVRHLGESGARKTCVDNHWSGVLSAIDRLN
ncbi:MAG: hypothetical protein AAF221_13975 [Pseudomonadota bacterium]